MKFVCISRNTQIWWKFRMSIVGSTSHVETVYFLCLTRPCRVDIGVYRLILSTFSQICSFLLTRSPLLQVLLGSSSSSSTTATAVLFFAPVVAAATVMLFSDYCCCHPLLWLLLGCSPPRCYSSLGAPSGEPPPPSLMVLFVVFIL